MRTPYFFLILLFLISCSHQEKKEKQLLEEKIVRIENGLQPNLQIQGDSIPKYNIEERMKELRISGVSIAMDIPEHADPLWEYKILRFSHDNPADVDPLAYKYNYV